MYSVGSSIGAGSLAGDAVADAAAAAPFAAAHHLHMPRLSFLRRGRLVPDNSSYVALCLHVKDEHSDIREWVLYHHMIGVDKFYIFDDYSSPPMSVVLHDLIASGLVDYTFEMGPLPGRLVGTNKQDQAYNYCLHQYGSRHKFMGFIDADEFVVLARDATLPALLRDYEQYRGLAMFSIGFGSSGHISRPAGGVLASYTKCAPKTPGGYVKSFVQPSKVDRIVDVHTAVYRDGGHAVDVWGREYKGPFEHTDRPADERAIIHHYHARSAEDWQRRARRGTNGVGGPPHPIKNFLFINNMSNQTCGAALPLAARLAREFGALLRPPARPGEGGLQV
ncbi:hypothetical protein Rsub_06813 [Raphidocelis subcapitata]|uniref:Glycosyltransferase family 92 protein n=1 Tax=Raphidocelis subcapitata TaxID=307507 RepID=A0A2V0P786_9CHLO|nr:hypothetical protein Rsub_06813 [Raphidocelis subcapitata]|eukprot:GBF93710.1 hypothetical protein Rsub_06813 [Raphidocelis subcapitata]